MEFVLFRQLDSKGWSMSNEDFWWFSWLREPAANETTATVRPKMGYFIVDGQRDTMIRLLIHTDLFHPTKSGHPAPTIHNVVVITATPDQVHSKFIVFPKVSKSNNDHDRREIMGRLFGISPLAFVLRSS